MKPLRAFTVFVAGLLLYATSGIAEPLDFTADTLPEESLGQYNADISQTSVSGLSAGAFMADQFFVAFSKDMLGVGIFAGGPYGCSEGSLINAFWRCMTPLTGYGLDDSVLHHLYDKAVDAADQGRIDSLANLHSKKVFIFSGTQDTTVSPEVSGWIDDWYLLAGVPAENIVYQDEINAGHALPTTDYGNACATTGDPWINDCDYDGAGQALSHILGALNPPRPRSELSGRFVKFNQNEFFDPPGLNANELKNDYSMNSHGFAYVPKSCSDGETCRIHVAFHGCKQVYNRNPAAWDYNADDATSPFGLQFVKYAGFNEWADTNNLIVLYPQAQKNQSINNPRGCFDWWGYIPGTAGTYATRQAPQMKAVYAMAERLAEGLQPACQGDNDPPVITLAGDSTIRLAAGDTLVLPSPEATAMDPEDGSLTTLIERTPAGPVDTNQPGVYELKYDVQDSDGCKAKTVSRKVIVTGCEQWTGTNDAHLAANRAFDDTCFFFFFPYQCYFAVGSEEALGSGSTTTTLRKEDPAVDFYKLGECE